MHLGIAFDPLCLHALPGFLARYPTHLQLKINIGNSSMSIKLNTFHYS